MSAGLALAPPLTGGKLTLAQRQRHLTCRHEAEHVVAYRHFNDRLRCVELLSDEAGQTYGLARVRTDTPLRAALRSLCGPASEFAFSEQVSSAHCDTDLRTARGHASATGLPFGALWAAACSIVAQHEGDIVILAAALAERGRLDADEIEALIGGGWASPRWG
jgi:hypothetical protein